MIEALIWFCIYLIVIGSVIGLVWWLTQAVGVPEPFQKLVRAGLIILGVIIILLLLLQLVRGHPMAP